MSFNLIHETKLLINNKIISKISVHSGENEEAIKKAFNVIIPSIIRGLTDQTSTPERAAFIHKLATEYYGRGVLQKTVFFENESGYCLNKDPHLMDELFGDCRPTMLISMIGLFSTIKAPSTIGLLNIALPLILGLLGKHVADNRLDEAGLKATLRSQKKNVSKAVPKGFNLESVFENFEGTSTDDESPKKSPDQKKSLKRKVFTAFKWSFHF